MLPPLNGDKDVFRWRAMIAFLVTGCIVCIICLYMIKANASELKDLARVVYIPTIQGLHRQYCLTNDPTTRDTLAQTIEEFQQDYVRATGIRFPLPSCQEIREQNGA